MACRQHQGSDRRWNREHEDRKERQAAPRARVVAGDVVADRLPALRVGVHVFIAGRYLRRNRTQMAALAQRTSREIIVMQRDFAGVPQCAQRRIRTEGDGAPGECHQKRE